MKSFKDTQGREWRITVNVTTIKRVRDLAGVDLLHVLDGKGADGRSLIERLIADPILLVDVLYAVCRPQCAELKVSDESFGEAMAGDAIEAATAALLDEIVSFSPSPRDRANLGRILEATRAGMERARELVEERLTSGVLSRVVDDAIDHLRRSAGAPSGAAPESSASTPAP
jgi:hypothetical protein